MAQFAKKSQKVTGRKSARVKSVRQLYNVPLACKLKKADRPKSPVEPELDIKKYRNYWSADEINQLMKTLKPNPKVCIVPFGDLIVKFALPNRKKKSAATRAKLKADKRGLANPGAVKSKAGRPRKTMTAKAKTAKTKLRKAAKATAADGENQLKFNCKPYIWDIILSKQYRKVAISMDMFYKGNLHGDDGHKNDHSAFLIVSLDEMNVLAIDNCRNWSRCHQIIVHEDGKEPHIENVLHKKKQQRDALHRFMVELNQRAEARWGHCVLDKDNDDTEKGTPTSKTVVVKKPRRKKVNTKKARKTAKTNPVEKKIRKNRAEYFSVLPYLNYYTHYPDGCCLVGVSCALALNENRPLEKEITCVPKGSLLNRWERELERVKLLLVKANHLEIE